MGLLVEGRWQDKWYESKDGTFQREQAQRRHWVTADGQPGPSGVGGFAAEPGDPVPGHEISLAMISPRLFEAVQNDMGERIWPQLKYTKKGYDKVLMFGHKCLVARCLSR